MDGFSSLPSGLAPPPHVALGLQDGLDSGGGQLIIAVNVLIIIMKGLINYNTSYAHILKRKDFRKFHRNRKI